MIAECIQTQLEEDYYTLEQMSIKEYTNPFIEYSAPN